MCGAKELVGILCVYQKTRTMIKEASSSFGPRRGFGAVKVQATINTSAWQTSVFPDSKDKSYILFIKKAIRTAEKISAGDTMEVKAKLI